MYTNPQCLLVSTVSFLYTSQEFIQIAIAIQVRYPVQALREMVPYPKTLYTSMTSVMYIRFLLLRKGKTFIFRYSEVCTSRPSYGQTKCGAYIQVAFIYAGSLTWKVYTFGTLKCGPCTQMVIRGGSTVYHM